MYHCKLIAVDGRNIASIRREHVSAVIQFGGREFMYEGVGGYDENGNPSLQIHKYRELSDIMKELMCKRKVL